MKKKWVGNSSTLVAEVSQELAEDDTVEEPGLEAVSPPIAAETSNWVRPEILSYWNGSNDVFETVSNNIVCYRLKRR